MFISTETNSIIIFPQSTPDYRELLEDILLLVYHIRLPTVYYISGEQVLIVTKGKGIVATEKEQVAVGPGDVIFIPAGEKHWHGAADGMTFSHLFAMSPGGKTTQLED